MQYTRIYEVVTEADSEEEANANFEEDGPECGPTCSEAVTIEPLSDEAVAAIAGLVASTFEVDGDRIMTEKWDEIRAAFPLEKFRQWAKEHPDFYAD